MRNPVVMQQAKRAEEEQDAQSDQDDRSRRNIAARIHGRKGRRHRRIGLSRRGTVARLARNRVDPHMAATNRLLAGPRSVAGSTGRRYKASRALTRMLSLILPLVGRTRIRCSRLRLACPLTGSQPAPPAGGTGGTGGIGRNARHAGMRMDAQPLRDVIQSKRIRQRQSVSAGHRRLVGVEDLVEAPRRPPGCRRPHVVAQAGQHGEDHDVRDRLGVLPVVHGADAGDNAQQAGQHGMRRAGKDRRGHSRPPPRSRSARHASQ